MNYRIKHPNNVLRGKLDLPSSKSLSNRALIIQALCHDSITLHNLSTAEDTLVLQEALNQEEANIDVGHAGTAMRFLTAYLATQEGSYILTGSERMKQRPIGLLVEALQEVGAEISYVGEEGYPPLHIKGKKLKGGEVSIDGSISSQFISALLLIAPTLHEGLDITLHKAVVSGPYIQMTLSIMQHFGIQTEKTSKGYRIAPQSYQANSLTIESDWSAAAFFLEMAALSEEANIVLPGLLKNSWQGDCQAAQLFEDFGLEIEFTNEGLSIQKEGIEKVKEAYDLLNTPDLAQALAATLVGLEKNCQLTGLQTLSIKECDRLTALQEEFKRFRVHADISSKSILLSGDTIDTPDHTLKTYDDHRMAMCLAPLALKCEEVIIENIGVVKKSFPNFWEELQKLGFTIAPVAHSSM